MPRKIDIVGQTYGRLRVLEFSHMKMSGAKVFKCRCECGTISYCQLGALRSGHTKSCGCLKPEVSRKANLKHGYTRKKEYRAWQSIKNRCGRKKDTHFHLYGGRGIRVCERWLESFENFIEDMGPAPTKSHSIDRINVNGDYSPANCRWATNAEQANNKRVNRIITISGQRMSMRMAADKFKINYSTLRHRISTGWSDHQAIGIESRPKARKAENNGKYTA